jgi:hypothetical protein
MGYLYNQVGEGRIMRSDILFAIGRETRQAVDEVLCQRPTIDRWRLRSSLYRSFPHVDRGEALLYFELRHSPAYIRDMMQDRYWLLRSLETFFHGYIKVILVGGFGTDWWRKGIPENIRVQCAEAWERDPEPAPEPYCYTTFMHLREIFQKGWDLFSKLPPPGPASDRRRFLSGFARLNYLRNCVMHPAKGATPDEVDFRFVREYVVFLQLDKWVQQSVREQAASGG